MKTKKEIEKMIDELCQLDQAIQDGRKNCKDKSLQRSSRSIKSYLSYSKSRT